MNRIDRRFSELREQGRCGLIPFVTTGHPHPDWTVDILHSLVEAGADLIELGMPFSDPMADGPVIQRASEKALAAGVTMSSVLEAVGEFRSGDNETPVILMGYLNPVVRSGIEEFAAAAAAAGVDGLLLVDCPPEECDSTLPAIRDSSLHQIFLVAPTTREARVARLADVAGGFVYYVSLKGVTGAGHLDIDLVARELDRIRLQVSEPLAVGFGVKTPEQAGALAHHADAVVVGSLIVSALDECADRQAAVRCCQSILQPLADAVRTARSADKEKIA